MFERCRMSGLALIAVLSIPIQMFAAPAKPSLSASQVVEKNVQARGGLQAWRAVQTITFKGTLGSGGNQRATLPAPLPGKKSEVLPTDPRPAEEVQLPFVMEMARPLKVRFELQFKGQTAVQVYDGVNGWKLRPYLNRRDVEPYTEEEIKKAAAQSELDGPLIDYASKGTTITLDGMEKVEDRDTYKLKLTLKNGRVLHDWIDAQTFLEAKIEGQPRRLDGIDHPVEVHYKEYRSVSGLMIPFVLETQVLPASAGTPRTRETPVPIERINIEKVTINPKLEASLFTRPEVVVAKSTLGK